MVNSALSQMQDLVSQRIFAASKSEHPFAALEQALNASFAKAEAMLVDDQSGERDLIACGPGCGYCCVVNVSLSLPEGLLITRFLQHLPGPVRARQREKLDLLWQVIRGLDDEERLACQRSCAFLGEDRCCSIYPVRPLLCRSVTSTDVQQCLKALEVPTFGAPGQVLMHQFQQQLYEAMFIGVTTGLSLAGWDDRSFQLTGLVRYLLQQDLSTSGYISILARGSRLQWADLYP